MTPLSYDVGKTILAFTPEISHAQVNKTFAAWTKKAMELEWRVLGSNPLLAKRVAAIADPLPLCFKKLLNEQREAFLTSTAYDAFVAAQPAFAGSYGCARFEKGAALLVEDAQEQDRNLERAWRGRLLHGIAWQLGLNPRAPGAPQTAQEIRIYLDEPTHLARINQVFELNFSTLELTGIPPELEKFPMLEQLSLIQNRIRNVPKEILNLRNLDYLQLGGNRFNHIPEILLRYNGFTGLEQNPIPIFSEEMYDHYFSVDNWLGKPFSDTNTFACFGFAYLFGFFRFHKDYYANRYMILERLTEIPFALWLREKLVIPNLLSPLLRSEQDLNCLPDFLKWTVLFTCAGISLILALPLWLLNQFLSLAVVPVVTKARELLGYGRMIRLD